MLNRPLDRAVTAFLAAQVIALLPGIRPVAADTVAATAMAFRSAGTSTGGNWLLPSNGYIGTYIQLNQPGSVTFDVNAAGTVGSGITPHMTFAIANQTQSFNVNAAGMTDYSYTTPSLPAGTYFVRVQLDNQTGTIQQPTITFNNFQVAGASLLNSNSTTNALNAAQTYIDNFRQGGTKLTLTDPLTHQPIAAGTNVQVRLVRNAFNLGSATYDNSEPNNFYGNYPWMTATPSSTGTAAIAYKYQQFLTNNFNMTEPENSGKWSSDEPSPGNLTMGTVDQLMNFATSHKLQVRMHNLIWHSQQPTFVNNLFTNNDVAGLNAAVTGRINYYVKSNNTQSGPAQAKPRALAYTEMDVLNEGAHAGATDNYITTLGNPGVASIYKQVANAAASVGANVRLYTNEYNVLQNSSDAYANWYLSHIQNINNAGVAAGLGKVVSGVGAEFYVTGQPINAAAMQQVMQNLAVTGLPFSQTEFAIASGTSLAQAGTDLQQAFTMIYGNPMATTFNFWDFWLALEQNDSFLTNYQAGALMDANGNPTPLYTNYFLPMMAQDNYILPGQITPTSYSVDANGQINFNGSYGTYAVTLNGQDFLFTSSPTATDLTVVVPEPASAALIAAGIMGALSGKRRARRKS
jgi:GH35 family endo-1,4-beta-xylanase